MLLVAATTLTLKLATLARNRAALRRSERGRRAHADAAAVLRAEGLEILGAEVPVKGRVYLDGEPRAFTLHLDYLVTDGAARFAVEVKSGAEAHRPHAGATRRQLLEYALLADVDAVLHLDMERRVLTEVDFELPGRAAPRHARRLPWFLAGLTVGVAVGALLYALARASIAG